MTEAPGAPGWPPTWCSSNKEMVGCALETSRLWFTVGYGIINEVYYPRVDIPQIRDLGVIVADAAGFWVEGTRLHRPELSLDGDGELRPYALLAPHLGNTNHNKQTKNTHQHGRRLMWAEQGPFGLALAAVDARQHDAFVRMSAGYVGVS